MKPVNAENVRARISQIERAIETMPGGFSFGINHEFELACLRELLSIMESRTVTVKLASRRLPSDYVDGEFGNDDLAAIHNACRLECKVSVEKYLSAHGIVVKWEDE